MRKVLIIGSGKISQFITKPDLAMETDCVVIPGSNLLNKQYLNSLTLSPDFDLVIFLAYDKTNPANNILMLSNCLRLLTRSKYKGEVIYLSSQAAIPEKLFKRLTGSLILNSISRYSIVKRMQVARLRSSTRIRSRVLYLPLVVGIDGPHDRFFEFLHAARQPLPLRNETKIYTLDIIDLVNFIFNLPDNQSKKNCSEIFVYSDYRSISNFLEKSSLEVNAVSLSDCVALFKNAVKEVLLLSINLLGMFRRFSGEKSPSRGSLRTGSISSISLSRRIQFSQDAVDPEVLRSTLEVWKA